MAHVQSTILWLQTIKVISSRHALYLRQFPSLFAAPPTLSPCSTTDSANASPTPLFSMIQCTCTRVEGVSLNDFRACRQAGRPESHVCFSCLAKSREAIDSGLWRVGRDEGMLPQQTHTQKRHTDSHLDHGLVSPGAIAG